MPKDQDLAPSKWKDLDLPKKSMDPKHCTGYIPETCLHEGEILLKIDEYLVIVLFSPFNSKIEDNHTNSIANSLPFTKNIGNFKNQGSSG